MRLYLESSVLLVTGAILLHWLMRKSEQPSRWLGMAYALLATALLAPLLMEMVPVAKFSRPAAQVWSGSSRKVQAPYYLIAPSKASSSTLRGWKIPRSSTDILEGILLGCITLGIFRLLYRRQKLQRFLRGQIPLHCVGKVRILLSCEASTAFSARLNGKAFVVIPLQLSSKADRAMVLAHELQHHRSADPQIALFLEWVKAFFFWNPAAYFFARAIEQLQEFACDASLTGHQRKAPQAYCRCLLQAAHLALRARPHFVGTTAMATSRSGAFLKRRIQMILKKPAPQSRLRAYSLAVGTSLLMVACAFETKTLIQNRTLSLEQAQAAATIASKGSRIPLDMNSRVLESLNHFAGTPEGRKFLKEAIARLPQFKPVIDEKISQYDLPPELIAIPLFESGLRNDVISADPHRGAGIWQFIAPTARRFGLRAMDEREQIAFGKDDRLDVAKETDAAMRYLKLLHSDFKDWRLAIKAYNEGEGRVRALIKSTGSRDPWVLEAKSPDANYLSGTIAVAILYKNPTLLD